MDYKSNINITFICTGIPKRLCDSLYVILALLWWLGNKSAISLMYACSINYFVFFLFSFEVCLKSRMHIKIYYIFLDPIEFVTFCWPVSMLHLIVRFLNVKSSLCYWHILYQIMAAVDFDVILNLDCLHFIRHIFFYNQHLDGHIEFTRNRFQVDYNPFFFMEIIITMLRNSEIAGSGPWACDRVLRRPRSVFSSLLSVMSYPSSISSFPSCEPVIPSCTLVAHSPPSTPAYAFLPSKPLHQTSFKNSFSVEAFLDLTSRDNASFYLLLLWPFPFFFSVSLLKLFEWLIFFFF